MAPGTSEGIGDREGFAGRNEESEVEGRGLLADGDDEMYEMEERKGGSGYASDEERDAYDDAGRRGRGRRTSASTAASFQLYTPDEEKAVVRKFDRRLVIFMAGLYMLSFLDRSSMSLFCSYVYWS